MIYLPLINKLNGLIHTVDRDDRQQWPKQLILHQFVIRCHMRDNSRGDVAVGKAAKSLHSPRDCTCTCIMCTGLFSLNNTHTKHTCTYRNTYKPYCILYFLITLQIARILYNISHFTYRSAASVSPPITTLPLDSFSSPVSRLHTM